MSLFFRLPTALDRKLPRKGLHGWLFLQEAITPGYSKRRNSGSFIGQRGNDHNHYLLHFAGQFGPEPKCCMTYQSFEVTGIFAHFISLFRQAVELGSTNTNSSCQAASPPGNSCFPRTYSTRSRIGFFLMRVNRAVGCLRQIAISSSRTVITPSRKGY